MRGTKMTETNLMSYNTFTFKTEAQMLLHIRLWEEKGKLLFAKLKQKGCTRFCYNQIWNKKGTYKTSTLFEYNSPQAYKDCQKAIDNFRQSIMKELEAISPVIESSRNVILQDLYRVEINKKIPNTSKFVFFLCVDKMNRKLLAHQS